LLAGVVASLIVSGLAYVRAKSQDPKIKEAADTGIYVGQLATATANKALENKQKLKEIIDFSLKIAPEEVKKILVEKQGLLEKLNKEIQATQAQIKRITPMIPGNAADTISDLPREKIFRFFLYIALIQLERVFQTFSMKQLCLAIYVQ
jgi:hypothetical protein